MENGVKAPLWFQDSFGLLSFAHGIDRNHSGGRRRCCTGAAACPESRLRDCVLLARLPEAWNSFVHPSSSPASSSRRLAFKRQGEVAGLRWKWRWARRVRGRARVNGHAVGRRDPVLPVDVASQQRRGAFWVWRWRAVTHPFLKAPVHPPVVGNILYRSPFLHSHGQQPVDQGAGIWSEHQDQRPNRDVKRNQSDQTILEIGTRRQWDGAFTWGWVGPAVTAFGDLLCERGVAGPIKWHAAVHQCIEQNSQGPAVHLADGNTQTHTC